MLLLTALIALKVNIIIVVITMLVATLGLLTFITALIIRCGKKGIFLTEVKSGEIVLTKKREQFHKAIGNGTEFWVEPDSGEVHLVDKKSCLYPEEQPKDILGLYWVGWWPFYQLHTYEFEWEKAHLDKHESRVQLVNSVRFRAGYPIVIRDMETRDQVRIGINLIATVRIVNVKKLLSSYKSNWFVNLREVIIDQIRLAVSNKKLEEVYGMPGMTVNFPGVIVESLSMSDIIVPPEIAKAREDASAAEARKVEAQLKADAKVISGKADNEIAADEQRRNGEVENDLILHKAKKKAEAAPLDAEAKRQDLTVNADMKAYELSKRLKALGNNLDAAELLLNNELGKDWAKAFQTNAALQTLVLGENPGLHRLFHITPETGKKPEKNVPQATPTPAEKPGKKEAEKKAPEAGQKPEEGASTEEGGVE